MQTARAAVIGIWPLCPHRDKISRNLALARAIFLDILSSLFVSSMELVGTEYRLLSRISQKSVSTNWRINKGTELAPRQNHFFFNWQELVFFTKKLTR